MTAKTNKIGGAGCVHLPNQKGTRRSSLWPLGALRHANTWQVSTRLLKYLVQMFNPNMHEMKAGCGQKSASVSVNAVNIENQWDLGVQWLKTDWNEDAFLPSVFPLVG